VRVLGFVTSPALPTGRQNTTWDGMIHVSDFMPSYYAWAAAAGGGAQWPPPQIPGRPVELAMGSEVIFSQPCIFSIDNHQGNVQGGV
jgi:hypothetical protein